MTTIFDRSIVRYFLQDGKTIDIFMYGARPDDLRSEAGFLKIVSAAKRIGIDLDANPLTYDIFPVEHSLPVNKTRHVYSRGRRSAEFV